MDFSSIMVLYIFVWFLNISYNSKDGINFLFTCIFSLIITGYRKDLEESDISELHPRDKSDEVVPKFEKVWKKELSKCAVTVYVYYSHFSSPMRATI